MYITNIEFRSTDLSHQPIIFPNLVNGFERNPTAAARSYHSGRTYIQFCD